jgi:hypothetical protein
MKKVMLWCIPMLVLIFSSCTKEPLDHLSQEEGRIYITNYDTAARFSNYQTFTIADSVAIIANNQFHGRERTDLDAKIISAVTAALQQRGYTRVNADQSPDLGVTVSQITNTSTQVVDYSNYGGYYNDYWDPYYWGYPGYDYYFPSYYGVYQSNETSLAVDVIDLKNATENNKLRDVWSGLIRGSGIFNGADVNNQVNALFSQSTYFTR